MNLETKGEGNLETKAGYQIKAEHHTKAGHQTKSGYQTITDFSQIDTSRWDPDTLVLFDIDNTTVTYKDIWMRDNHKDQKEGFLKKLKEKSGDQGVTEYYESAKYIVTHDSIYGLFDKLRKRNIPYIGLTARRTGLRSDCTISTEDLILRNLAGLNVGFDANKYPDNFYFQIPDTTETLDPTLFNWSISSRIQCKQGIIFCCNKSKSVVLDKYLEHSIRTPSKIVFLDDVTRNLDSIANFCKTKWIDHELYLVDCVE